MRMLFLATVDLQKLVCHGQCLVFPPDLFQELAQPKIGRNEEGEVTVRLGMVNHKAIALDSQVRAAAFRTDSYPGRRSRSDRSA